MMMRSQTARAERAHTRPAAANDAGERGLGAVVELNWPSSRFTSAADVEIPPPLLATESLLLRFLDRLELWLQRSQQRRQLRSLSDRMLKDIGVSRADAEYETSRRFWQD